jgi:hypothetical protein
MGEIYDHVIRNFIVLLQALTERCIDDILRAFIQAFV